MKPHRIVLHFEGGLSIQTEEPFSEGIAHEELEDLMQDRETGPWKQIGNVSFIWKRLVAFEVEEIGPNGMGYVN